MRASWGRTLRRCLRTSAPVSTSTCAIIWTSTSPPTPSITTRYKKLTERRDTADVTELLKELHRIVNAAIQAQTPGDDQAEGLTFDLSQIDLEKLRDEFAKKVKRKATALQDIREIVEQKLAEMLKHNPQRMDYYKRYQEIIADYNREKDRATIEETFAKLAELVASLDEEQRRAAEEGLRRGRAGPVRPAEKGQARQGEREKVKQASQALLASLRELLAPLERWTEKEQTTGRGRDLHSGPALHATAVSAVHGGGKAARRRWSISTSGSSR